MLRKECDRFKCSSDCFSDCEEKEKYDCIGNEGFQRCGCECCEHYSERGDMWNCDLGIEYGDCIEDTCHYDIFGDLDLKCAVCGKSVTEDSSFVCASSFGGTTFRFCRDCFHKGVEPYGNMVSYISCAGRFPDDINETFQKRVRDNLSKLGISEEQFIKDVDDCIAQWDDLESSEEPSDVDYDVGFDPYLGCFTDDC